jgi:hypothetical protein
MNQVRFTNGPRLLQQDIWVMISQKHTVGEIVEKEKY